MNKQWLFAKEKESRFSFVLSIWPWKTITLFLGSKSYFHRLLIILLSFMQNTVLSLLWRKGYVSYSCHSNSWICSACIKKSSWKQHILTLSISFGDSVRIWRKFCYNKICNVSILCMFHRKETLSLKVILFGLMIIRPI